MRSVIALLSGALLLAACGADEPTPPTAALPGGGGSELPHAVIHDGPHDAAVLTVRDMGEIRIELYPEVAPKTVENFVKLAKAGFYDGTQFHRVIPGFMIQGGDPNTKGEDTRTYGKGGPGYTIEDEFTDLSHTRGTLSMANKGTPRTGGSQFFILHQDTTGLDGRHATFGRVTDGMDLVDAITEVEIDTYGRYGPRDRPHPVPAVVESIRIEPAKTTAAAPEAAADAAADTETERTPGEPDAAGTEGGEQQEEEDEMKGREGKEGGAPAGEMVGS
jgi:peptidyl-prolyl cis-trans isomerase B (cyclophilin B)